MAPRLIIIDCDPGHDDALAILLALGSPDQLDVLALTVVAGNVPLTLTEKNARKVCELAARSDLPVYAGCGRPLVHAQRRDFSSRSSCRLASRSTTVRRLSRTSLPRASAISIFTRPFLK